MIVYRKYIYKEYKNKIYMYFQIIFVLVIKGTVYHSILKHNVLFVLDFNFRPFLYMKIKVNINFLKINELCSVDFFI